MLRELSDILEKQLMKLLRSSPCVGIGLDESTDRAVEKHLVIVIRLISPTAEVHVSSES